MGNEEVGELGIEADEAEPRDKVKTAALTTTCGFARIDVGRLVKPVSRNLSNRIAKASSSNMANEGIDGLEMEEQEG